MSSSFRGTEDSVNRALGAYIDRLKHIPHDLETDVKNAEHIIRGEAKEVEHKTTQILQPQSTEEEDDGWASDRSDGQQATASTSTPTRRRNRSKSPTSKSRVPPKAIGAPPRKGRRRSSMRKGMLGRVHILKHKHPDNPSVFEDSDGESDDHRGRSHGAFTNVKDDLNRHGSPRNPRFDSIRRIHALRDQSPARSIRFADEVEDENISGTNTPRVSILQEPSPGSPLQPSLDAVEFPKN